MQKLWDLCRAEVFLLQAAKGEGKDISIGGGTRTINFEVKQVMTPREMDKILNLWDNDKSGQKELDYYIFQVLIESTTDPAEKWYKFQLLKIFCNFFKSPGWEKYDIPFDDISKGDTINYNIDNIKKPKNIPDSMEFFTARQMIDMLYGKGPERTEWPNVEDAELKKRQKKEEFQRKKKEVMDYANEIDERIKSLEKEIEDFCKQEEAETQQATA